MPLLLKSKAKKTDRSTRIYNKYFLLCLLYIFSSYFLTAQRIPVLNQIDLPHNYYFRELYLPQLTSGPSSVCWSADGKYLIYSMNGSLWKQEIGKETAEQLTNGNGYDYQPDCSPDGKQIIFVRYNGDDIQLMLLDILSHETYALTNNKAINLEPRWSPNGKSIAFVSTYNSGHFLLFKARIDKNNLSEIECLIPERKSVTKRYYYSAFDHAINPVWSKDGKEIYCVSNRETAHGTGDIICINSRNRDSVRIIRNEETQWNTRPDISPDGSRMVYSSYLGGNWHQLWMLPLKGGSPLQVTYGDYDNTYPRWSPDGRKIAFISNRNGNTALWLLNVYDGGQTKISANSYEYLQPHTNLQISIRDEKGNTIPARISITDSHEKFFCPAEVWIQADDSRYPNLQQFETHYFYYGETFKVSVPIDNISIQVAHGPEYEILKTVIDTRQKFADTIFFTLKKKTMPADFGNWWSGDMHVHMNYGGHYLATPQTLLHQAKAEDLNFIFNLIVNKEQRIPDIKYFSPGPDKVSDSETILLHAQEFHTSFWGHLGIVNLNDHLIIPGYAGYPQTAVSSIFPNNSFIADKAHEQHALVGYAHPFESSEIFPDQSPTLSNELPVDAAFGKVDYYELIGFSDHKASEAVWYQLLNCGIHIPAAAGTDAMTNYASLRGPVGLNRVYVKADGFPDENKFLANIKAGKSFVTNGPVIGLTVENKNPGDSILINPKGETLSYTAFLRSNVGIDSFEIVWNGEVIEKHLVKGNKTSADIKGLLKIKGSGWLLLRAWSQHADPDLPDIYPYSSTNPIYIYDGKTSVVSKSAAQYFLKWVNRVHTIAINNTTYRNEEERKMVLTDIEEAEKFYKNCILGATKP